MPDVEVSTHIAAPPEQVWELIGDPTRMGEWSPECRRVTWAAGSRSPAAGARFRGHNQLGWRRWTTTGTIVAYEPSREIAWDVDVSRLPVARWGYRVVSVPGDDGCTLVEHFTDRRPRMFQMFGGVARGVRDTEAHNRAGMEETVRRVKAAAESA